MRARDFLKESKPQHDIHSIVRKFLPFVQQHLELSDLPEIELLDQSLEGTFGRYSDGNIRVMAHGRHPIDVLRTLAHELVHYKQDSEGRIHDDSGETGSDEENEANAVAGVIMRDFDQANPELLAALKESRVAEDATSMFQQNYQQTQQGLEALKTAGINIAENNDNYEIRNYEKLDSILVKLCQLVIQGQQDDAEQYGMVAAAVLDPDNNLVASTSSRTDNGWRHAERNALDAYEQEYGEIPDGCIIITTLAPCSDQHDKTARERYGESCTNLINNSPIRKVYCGLDDPTQDEPQRHFNVMETSNDQIRDLCRDFAKTFLGSDVLENFKDGRHPEDKGDSKRYGINTKASVSSLRKTAHQGGRKGQLAHWLANMKAGRAKKS